LTKRFAGNRNLESGSCKAEIGICTCYSGFRKVAKDDISYYYSSVRFYEYGIDEFGFLNNLYEVFDGE